MKNQIRILLLTAGVIIAAIAVSQAQNKVDEQRMQRDIQVAENVLSTIIKQQFGNRNYFPMDVQGSYVPGFGVTFRLPLEFAGQIMLMLDQPRVSVNGFGAAHGQGFSYSYQNSGNGLVTESDDNCEDCPAIAKVKTKAPKTKNMVKIKGPVANDSMRIAYNNKIILAAKTFIADYGDLIGQLPADERIMITNRTEHSGNNFFWQNGDNSPRVFLSLEASKADLIQFRQGKLNRDQFIAKIKTVNTETMEDLSPDLELLSSIFNRLYRADLSKTYFIQEEVYYERLKDFGVIYGMHVYSSNGMEYGTYDMPTLGLTNVNKEERYKKVKELYPLFEKNLLDDIIEYGKTLRSLKENEMVVFNVQLTECKGCNIPSSLEITVKEAVLMDYGSGKLSKEAAVAKMSVKKGADQ